MSCANATALMKRADLFPRPVVFDAAQPRQRRSLLGGFLVGAGLAGAAWMLDALQRSRSNRRLHRTLVDLLLNALTADDSLTARHSRRVADLTDVLAAALRLGRVERATLRVASLLHDMGKVDDRYFHILHSREPLSEGERAQIKTHPHQSASILRPLEPFHPGLQAIVSCHHECWNGQGYPEALGGTEIPVGARIIAVADVFDALTQPRAYHGPLSPDEVLKKIRDAAGTQFDPAVVRILDAPDVRAKWREIAKQGRDEERAAEASAEGGEAGNP